MGDYAKKNHEYAESYKRSVRVIQRWKKEGAPLDDPKAMVGFIAEKDLAAGKMPPPPKGGKRKSIYAVQVNEEKFAVDGLEGYAARLPELEKATAAAMVISLQAGDLGQMKHLMEIHTRFGRELRETEKAKPGISRGNKNAFDAGEVKEAWTGMVNAFIRLLDSLPNISGRLEGFDIQERKAIIQKEVDAIKRALHTGKFSKEGK